MGKPVSFARKFKASLVSPTKEEEMNYQNSIRSSNNKENKLYNVILSNNTDKETYSKESIIEKVEEINDIKKQSLLIPHSTLYNDIEVNESNKYENGINFTESPSNIKNTFENHNISKALDFNDVDNIIPIVQNSPYKSIHNSIDYNEYQHEDGNGYSNNNYENNEEIIEEEIIEEIIDDNDDGDDDKDFNDDNNEEDDEDEIDNGDDDRKDNIDNSIDEEDEYDIVNPGEEDSQCIEVYEDELENANKENSTSWFNIDNYSFHILLAYVMLLLLITLIIYRIDHDGSIILSENKDVISVSQYTSYNNINKSLDCNFIEADKVDIEFNLYINEVFDEVVSINNSTDNNSDEVSENKISETELYIYSNDINFDAIEDISETAIMENEINISTNVIDNQVLNKVDENAIEENILLPEDNNEQFDENSQIEPITTDISLQTVSNNQIISDADAIEVKTSFDVAIDDGSSDDLRNIETHEVNDVVTTNAEVYEEVLDNVIEVKTSFDVAIDDGSSDDLRNIETHEVNDVVTTNAEVYEEVLDNVILDAAETNIILESVELVDVDITTTEDIISVDNIIAADETTEVYETNGIESVVEDDLDHTTNDLASEIIGKITSDEILSPDVNVNSISCDEDPVVTNNKIYFNTDNDVSDPTLVFICLVVTSISAIIGLLYISTFQKNDLNDLTNEIIFDNELAYLSNHSTDNSINTIPNNISLSWENDVKKSFDIPVNNDHFDNDFTSNSSSHSSNSNLSYSVRRSERLRNRLHIS